MNEIDIVVLIFLAIGILSGAYFMNRYLKHKPPLGIEVKSDEYSHYKYQKRYYFRQFLNMLQLSFISGTVLFLLHRESVPAIFDRIGIALILIGLMAMAIEVILQAIRLKRKEHLVQEAAERLAEAKRAEEE